MEEQEVGLENVHDIVHEGAHRTDWAEKVALTTVFLAVLAASANLMSTHESDKSILISIKASDKWAYYQAKGIKSMVTQNPAEVTRYKDEQEVIRKEAEELDRASEEATHIHEFFAYSVTIFQVATGIGALAVLVKKKMFWYSSLALGGLGIALVIKAISLF
jgi:uncharacterized membrane protein YkgB